MKKTVLSIVLASTLLLTACVSSTGKKESDATTTVTTTSETETTTTTETTAATTTTSMAPLTNDQALTAIKNYLYAELGYDKYNGEAPWYADIDAKSTDSTAVVYLRAYTGSHNFFYIDRISGETHEKAYPPHLNIDVDEPIDGATFNARDYLNRTPSTEPSSETTPPSQSEPETTAGSPSQSSTKMPEQTTKAIGKTKVSDAYKKTTTCKYHKNKVTDRIPKVTIEGVNTDKINKTIYNKCKPKLNQCGCDYEYYIGKTYVSIIIEFKSDEDFPSLYVYNISRKTGKNLSRKGMLKELGISASKFKSNAKKAIKKANKGLKNQEKALYNQAISQKTLNKAIPCVNRKGKVCFYSKSLYSPQGSLVWAVFDSSGTYHRK